MEHLHPYGLLFIAHELSHCSVDIAALSETRLTEEGSISEPGGGYTFFCKGKAKTEDRVHGVGLAVKTSLLQQLPILPVVMSKRLLKLRIPLSSTHHATIISTYAPTLTCSSDTKEQFYEDLNGLIMAVPATEKVILTDFNARVGIDNENWKGVIGSHGTGKMNSNGLLLLIFCAENNLTITNNLYREADKHKTTWMYPRSKQCH